MKHLFLFSLLSISIAQANSHPLSLYIEKPIPGIESVKTLNNGEQLDLSPGNSRMPVAVFKSQEYCRAELKDFEFNAHFSIVSANVYFTGKNFDTMKQGTINSSSLKPISDLMARCVAGSVVIFDDVKVKGPDNTIRTIQGMSLVLY